MSGFRGGITGESISAPLKVGFDRRLKLQFHGAKLSSDGGLIVFRELDDALGLSEMASWELRDNRTGKNSRHNLLAMFRQSVFGRLAGYEDVNDAGRLARDPVMRAITGRKDFDRRFGKPDGTFRDRHTPQQQESGCVVKSQRQVGGPGSAVARIAQLDPRY